MLEEMKERSNPTSQNVGYIYLEAWSVSVRFYTEFNYDCIASSFDIS